MQSKPSIGKKAPLFTGTGAHSEAIKLTDFLGKKLVLFFYPADDTPTCTNQACNLRDNMALLTQHDIQVLGVSPDTEKKHQKFIEKYDLPFPLIADTNQEIMKKYGVWDWKKFMGKTYMGVHRTTFLINEKGKIDHIIDKVKSKDHAQQILNTWGIDKAE